MGSALKLLWKFPFPGAAVKHPSSPFQHQLSCRLLLYIHPQELQKTEFLPSLLPQAVSPRLAVLHVKYSALCKLFFKRNTLTLCNRKPAAM
ncbi:hypothetical protein GDO78_008145 [Eleutherodactylus coqui]|uniref:Uncharacterized protein n=1 Tax=Eleutherodactylus coqui TaxID=57060 RepID=A0A8J6K9M3_ELECQ|nr:hypothetical protein GDO78_008145 [Eleutherodactylus coqui]